MKLLLIDSSLYFHYDPEDLGCATGYGFSLLSLPFFFSLLSWLRSGCQDAIRSDESFSQRREEALCFRLWRLTCLNRLASCCPSVRLFAFHRVCRQSQCVPYYWSCVKYRHVCLTCASSTSHVVLISPLFYCLFACKYICMYVYMTSSTCSRVFLCRF